MYNKNAEKLLLQLCRYTIDGSNYENAINSIQSYKIPWDYFLACCFKNKIVGLVYENAIKFNLEKELPRRISQVMRVNYGAHSIRNELHLDELRRICKCLDEDGIDYRALKGPVLISNGTYNLGSRVLSDLDIFIDRSNIKKTYSALKKLGYLIGKYDARSCTIENYSKEEKIIRNIDSINILEHVKLVDCAISKFIVVDVSFGFSYEEMGHKSKDILQNKSAINGFVTLPKDLLLIHLCIHLHKELTEKVWLDRGLDCCLIKFCDIALFSKKVEEEFRAIDVANRAKQLEFGKDVRVVLDLVIELFPNKFLQNIASQLDIAELDFTIKQHGLKTELSRASDLRKSIFSIEG